MFEPTEHRVEPPAHPIALILERREQIKLRRTLGPGYRKHPFYQVRVLGESPASGPKSVFGLEAVEQGTQRWTEDDSNVYGQLAFGVAPSRYGDAPTVIQPVRGKYAYIPKAIPGKVDGPKIANAVVEMLEALVRGTDRCPCSLMASPSAPRLSTR